MALWEGFLGVHLQLIMLATRAGAVTRASGILAARHHMKVLANGEGQLERTQVAASPEHRSLTACRCSPVTHARLCSTRTVSGGLRPPFPCNAGDVPKGQTTVAVYGTWCPLSLLS